MAAVRSLSAVCKYCSFRNLYSLTPFRSPTASKHFWASVSSTQTAQRTIFPLWRSFHASKGEFAIIAVSVSW